MEVRCIICVHDEVTQRQRPAQDGPPAPAVLGNRALHRQPGLLREQRRMVRAAVPEQPSQLQRRRLTSREAVVVGRERKRADSELRQRERPCSRANIVEFWRKTRGELHAFSIESSAAFAELPRRTRLTSPQMPDHCAKYHHKEVSKRRQSQAEMW